MARANTPTLLSLDTLGMELGANPCHFNQAEAGEVFPVETGLNDLTTQWGWQGASCVGLEEIARTLAKSEDDVGNYLEYSPAPKWEVEEFHPFTGHEYIQTDRARIIQPGRRNSTYVDTVDVTYTDEDGDGFAETATITCSTEVENIYELKIYFEGKGGDPAWEIRPANTKTLSGGTLTVTFFAWMMIKPTVKNRFTTLPRMVSVDVSNSSNLVETVDVYREYTDNSEYSVEFVYQNAPSQWGFMGLNDPKYGKITPYIGTYDDGWHISCEAPSCYGTLVGVRLWYYAGLADPRFWDGLVYEPMLQPFARALMYLTVARLERPLCSCTTIKEWCKELQTDLAIGENTVPWGDLDNPFGTRRGEIDAWRDIDKIHPKRYIGVVI